MIDLQSIGAELMIYGEIDDPAMRYFNPSLAFHNGELKIAIRSCNFAVVPKGKWYLRDGSAYSKTDVIYGDIDPDTLQVTNLQKLKLSKNSPIQALTAGLEDVRLFSRKDGMHAVGFESDRLTRSLHNASAKMAEYLIKGNELKYIRTLDFDFTYSPTQVWKDGKVTGLPYTEGIHGGSQLLKQPDGSYLSIVHEKLLEKPQIRQLRPTGLIYDKFLYVHYLAKHNSNGMVVDISKPFRFGTLENIEFASGMVEYDGNFLISLGIRDCKLAICRINKTKLMGLFD